MSLASDLEEWVADDGNDAARTECIVDLILETDLPQRELETRVPPRPKR